MTSEPTDGEAIEMDPDEAFSKIEDTTEWISIPVDDLVEICDSYLSRLPFTLWADWAIADPKSRIVAARWLSEQIKNVAEEAMKDE